MKRLIAVSFVLALVVTLPGVAIAKPPTAAHVRTYTVLYHKVAHRFGHRTPGRNIVRDGTRHGKASDAAVVRSIAVLRRMMTPPPVYKPVVYTQPVTPTTTTTPVYTASAPVTTTAPSSSLEACIIRNESGGNPQATNGQYAGIGQWSPSSWQTYSHGQYGSSPLDATYAQQQQVLASEGTSGMISQQGIYDGCA